MSDNAFFVVMSRSHGWGALRVLNEESIDPGTGFPLHPHAKYEIFTYVVSGAVAHTDSMGSKETIERGSIQHTSAGSGIRHSEYNASKKDLLTLLQIWLLPDPSKANMEPVYITKGWKDDDKRNTLLKVLSGKKEEGQEVIPLRNEVVVYASILEHDHSVTFSLAANRKGYLHMIAPQLTTQTGSALRVKVEEGDEAKAAGALPLALTEGDALLFTGPLTLSISSTGSQAAEFLVFDLPP